MFVSHSEFGHPFFKGIVASPDEQAEGEATWRRLVLAYNSSSSNNAFGLHKAYQLYQNPAYEALVNKFGSKEVFILSAGWGLVRSDFLLPTYDITFKGSRNRPYLWRRKKTIGSTTSICYRKTLKTRLLIWGYRLFGPFCQSHEAIWPARRSSYIIPQAYRHGRAFSCYPTRPALELIGITPARKIWRLAHSELKCNSCVLPFTSFTDLIPHVTPPSPSSRSLRGLPDPDERAPHRRAARHPGEWRSSPRLSSRHGSDRARS